jgi:hypothetical protein
MIITLFSPEDGGNILLPNVGSIRKEYTAQRILLSFTTGSHYFPLSLCVLHSFLTAMSTTN